MPITARISLLKSIFGVAFVAVLLPMMPCDAANNPSALDAKIKKGSFTDSRDGKSYKTVKLGNQTWMAENLDYNANGSKCYKNQESNCQKYGRLYNWGTAKSACPSGWHLPSKDEWQALVNLAEISGDGAGNVLKSFSDWNDGGNGDDAVGFSALPGGYGSSGGSFNNVGYGGYWWGSSESNAFNAYYRFMVYYNEDAYKDYEVKSYLFSVRCVQE